MATVPTSPSGSNRTGSRAPRDRRARPALLAPLACLVLLAIGAACSLTGPVHRYTHPWEAGVTRDPAPGRPLVVRREGEAVTASDEHVSLRADIHPGRIALQLTAHGSPATLLVAEATHVDADGTSRPLHLALGRRADAPAWDGRLAPGRPVEVYAWPREWLRTTVDGRLMTRGADSPFTGQSAISEGGAADAASRGQQWVGKSFELRLPVETAGLRLVYRLRFTATGVRVDRITWA